MKPALRNLLSACLMGTMLLGSSAWAQTAPNRGVPVGAALHDLIEADWLARDQTAVAEGNGAGGRQPFALERTRDVLVRAEKLAERFAPRGEATRLGPLVNEVRELAKRCAEPRERNEAERQALYLEARWRARRVAFCNPLLDFDKLLFIKRHDAAGVFHMCDQFYGCNAVPGGGLFVLEGPFGPEPKLVDLLEHSTVERGRLAGQQLRGGSFLAPELSFDGSTVLFAYTQATAYAQTKGKEAYLWGPEISFHIFRVRTDGTGLVQLTDGDADDFDPCFLPNGRIVFVTERRGGFLRCGRHCPVYTMFSMNADGGDITCLSYHETHEWQPSVANDGKIVYTRWDYVDRDTNIAHHIWTCFPDGRDPRSFHGNYPAKRECRPWMELDIRAIPGTDKFVATTGSHHGHAFGSLVIIDPTKEDDGASAQLTRLTPEVPFPEAEAKDIAAKMVYGTAWPLGPDDFLCAYDPGAKNHGIYWIDSAGNKELIYRGPQIASISPVPLRPRPMPPAIPDQTSVASGNSTSVNQNATIAVMNVHDSDFTWPAGRKVSALRVVQVLPKSTPAPNDPRIGIAEQTNARAVLGTVPVEADGSAYFEAPVGKPIYFQALDDRGLAVQSMRSATYVHPGESLTCRGCHERKHDAAPVLSATPIALRRAPSPIRPEVSDGANPFNYVRLVQPVLERNCVACHREKKALDLSNVLEGPNGWSRSYANLSSKYGFYYHVNNGSINTGVHGGSRSIAGHFGAAAAPLLPYLDESHHGVKLSQDEFHRITLWLDCNSEFLGAYEDAPAQARGELVRPALE